MATLTKRGAELLDQTPVALPLGLYRSRDTPLHQRIRNMILKAKQEEHEGYESFEDADDFVVEEDPSSFDASTPYEEHFDHLTGDTYFPEQKARQNQKAQLEAFNAFIESQKKNEAASKKQNAAVSGGVSSPHEPPAEPPKAVDGKSE